MRTSWSASQSDYVSVSPLCPLCSHLSCTAIPKEDAIFRKNHFLGPVCYATADVAPYVTFIASRSHWCCLSSRACWSCSAELLPHWCTSSPYCCSGLSCSTTGLGFCLCWIFRGSSQATPGFWALWTAAQPSCTHNCSFHIFNEDAVHPFHLAYCKMQRVLAWCWPLRVTPLVTSHQLDLKLLMATQSVFHPLLFHPSSPQFSWGLRLVCLLYSSLHGAAFYFTMSITFAFFQSLGTSPDCHNFSEIIESNSSVALTTPSCSPSSPINFYMVHLLKQSLIWSSYTMSSTCSPLSPTLLLGRDLTVKV